MFFKRRSTTARPRGVFDAAANFRVAKDTTLSYVPRRHSSVGAHRRDLTLPAGFIPPCLPMTAPCIPSGSLWLHEIKHHGFRIIARNDGRQVRLYGRSGNDLTARYPRIVEVMARLPPCTIDGEAIACDDNNVPSFELLRGGLRDQRVFLYAFDLIELRGEDRRRDALADRKVALSRLLAVAGPGVLAGEWVDGDAYDGAAVFKNACSFGFEGIVSKRKDSRYISGRSPYWLKMTNTASEVARAEAKSSGADPGPIAATGGVLGPTNRIQFSSAGATRKR